MKQLAVAMKFGDKTVIAKVFKERQCLRGGGVDIL